MDAYAGDTRHVVSLSNEGVCKRSLPASTRVHTQINAKEIYHHDDLNPYSDAYESRRYTAAGCAAPHHCCPSPETRFNLLRVSHLLAAAAVCPAARSAHDLHQRGAQQHR
eukprot:6186370-Pleurochrysis_carterae.AAC.2